MATQSAIARKEHFKNPNNPRLLTTLFRKAILILDYLDAIARRSGHAYTTLRLMLSNNGSHHGKECLDSLTPIIVNAQVLLTNVGPSECSR
jgi:hypothetical protein